MKEIKEQLVERLSTLSASRDKLAEGEKALLEKLNQVRTSRVAVEANIALVTDVLKNAPQNVEQENGEVAAVAQPVDR